VDIEIRLFPHTYPDAFQVALIKDMTNGMQYLKKIGIVHGDLKAVNVLVDFQWTAYLSDFGVSSFVKPTLQDHPQSAVCSSIESTQQFLHSSASGGGTPRYMAPERLLPEIFRRESGRATFESDTYSLVMFIYEI